MPTPVPIIYLNGPSRAGKSTLAKALVAAEVNTTHASAEECASFIKAHLATNPEPTDLARLRATS